MPSMEEKRIYVIVAETVQNPLEMKYVVPGHCVMRPTPDTKTIVQPKGRIGAQIGHVTSEMRMSTLVDTLFAKKRKLLCQEDLRVFASQAITTIVLAVPDSFQLEFRHYLLRRAGAKVHMFFDQNPEYGPGVVKTAICTEPVVKDSLVGPLDYLQLWSDDDDSN